MISGHQIIKTMKAIDDDNGNNSKNYNLKISFYSLILFKSYNDCQVLSEIVT